jgi:hypothetical protein
MSAPDPARAMVQRLRADERDALLAGGVPRAAYQCACSSGPCVVGYAMSTRGVEVDAYTDEEWATELEWHAYWRAHGYKTNDEALRARCPRAPGLPERRVFFSWARMRALVREAAEPEQLVLL